MLMHSAVFSRIPLLGSPFLSVVSTAFLYLECAGPFLASCFFININPSTDGGCHPKPLSKLKGGCSSNSLDRESSPIDTGKSNIYQCPRYCFIVMHNKDSLLKNHFQNASCKFLCYLLLFIDSILSYCTTRNISISIFNLPPYSHSSTNTTYKPPHNSAT